VVGELPPDGVVLAGVVAPLDGVVAPLDGEVEPLADVPVPLVEELLELVVVVAVLAATAGGVLGTLNCGAPEVSAVPVPPPPQAASPTPARIASTIAPADLDLRAPGRLTASRPVPRLLAARATSSGGEGLHAPAAHRAIVEILLGQLVTPVAEPQVVDGPGQLGGGGRERQELRDHLQFLARLVVQIDLVRLGLNDHFAAR
jgi:hypothetical protein